MGTDPGIATALPQIDDLGNALPQIRCSGVTKRPTMLCEDGGIV
jgi:hypothetical protein